MLACPVRESYATALKSSISAFAFRSIIAGLLSQDDLFFSGYAEMLWAAQEEKDDDAFIKTLHVALEKIRLFFSESDIRELILNKQDGNDLSAIVEILEIATRDHRTTFWQRSKIELLASKAQALLTQSSPKEPSQKHLALKTRIDITDLKQEVTSLPAYWWLVEVSRQQKIISHRDTRHISIRTRPSRAVEFNSFDGVHESVPTTAARALPRIHSQILALAETLHLSLGGVNVVQMNPWSQAFRHWDSEPDYIGRNRYHLILSCSEGNTLSSGTDTVTAQEGEVWFFDNKAMHRAHNKSDTPRIHVIFDGYPLQKHTI